MARDAASGVRTVLEGDDVEIMREEFFTHEKTSERPAAKSAKPKPEHYKVICISMYNRDLERLDEIVSELKRRGFTKANRSAVLRVAVEQLDLDRVPRGL